VEVIHQEDEPFVCPACTSDSIWALRAMMEAQGLTPAQRVQHATQVAVNHFVDADALGLHAQLPAAFRERLPAAAEARWQAALAAYDTLPAEEQPAYLREVVRPMRLLAQTAKLDAETSRDAGRAAATKQRAEKPPKYSVATLQRIIDRHFGRWQSSMDPTPPDNAAYLAAINEAGIPISRKTFHRYTKGRGLRIPPYRRDK
jgi:hypothetical protein